VGAILRQLKSGHRDGHDACCWPRRRRRGKATRRRISAPVVGAAGLAVATGDGIDSLWFEIDAALESMASANANANAIAADVIVRDIDTAAGVYIGRARPTKVAISS